MIGLIVMPIAYILGIVTYKNYIIWSKGSEGEKLVTRSLRQLNDNYYLINGITLSDSRGDTDHIVLGPNGIFVIETKNYSGEISCDGDEWKRQKTSKRGKSYNIEIGSPSNQVKRNSKILKDLMIKNKGEIFKRYSNKK